MLIWNLLLLGSVILFARPSDALSLGSIGARDSGDYNASSVMSLVPTNSQSLIAGHNDLLHTESEHGLRVRSERVLAALPQFTQLCAFCVGCLIVGVMLIHRIKNHLHSDKELHRDDDLGFSDLDWCSMSAQVRPAALTTRARDSRSTVKGGDNVAEHSCLLSNIIEDVVTADETTEITPLLESSVAHKPHVRWRDRHNCRGALRVGVLPSPERVPSKQFKEHHVTFALDLNTEHEVTAYSEVYGIHPRNFDFDKRSDPPSWCFVGDAGSDSEDSDSEIIGALVRMTTMAMQDDYGECSKQGLEFEKVERWPFASRCSVETLVSCGDQGIGQEDEQETQSPNSSERSSDGSADSSTSDEEECMYGEAV